MINPSLGATVAGGELGITRQALDKCFTQKAVDFFLTCLSIIMQHKVKCKEPLEARALKKFAKIRIFDSSGWVLPPALKGIFPGSGGVRSEAGCKIQLGYEYKSGEISFGGLTPATFNDQKYSKNLPSYIGENELYIADLGYFSLDTLHAIDQKKAFFLSRLLSGTGVWLAENEQRVEVSHLLKKQKENFCEFDITIGKTKGNKPTNCRLLCFRVPEEVANLRRNKMKERGRNRGSRTPSKEALQLCDWTLFVTNAPKQKLPYYMAPTLYRIRWQIELIFKQFKSTVHIDRSNTKNHHRIKCEIYGKLIAASIIHNCHGFINAKLWNKTNREVSFNKFWKRIQERAFQFMQLLIASLHTAVSFLRNQIRLLIPNAIKLKQKSRKNTLDLLIFCYDNKIYDYQLG